MSEPYSHETPEPPNNIMKMPAEKIATSTLAREMAGKIAIDAVGSEGVNKDKLNEIYFTEYALRRNELERIAGHEEPYAEKQIRSGEIGHKESD